MCLRPLTAADAEIWKAESDRLRRKSEEQSQTITKYQRILHDMFSSDTPDDAMEKLLKFIKENPGEGFDDW